MDPILLGIIITVLIAVFIRPILMLVGGLSVLAAIGWVVFLATALLLI